MVGLISITATPTIPYPDPAIPTTEIDMSTALKALQTTGSIPASSNQLTCASVTGFAVNDYVIVEIGTEAGLGAPGTTGVGGTVAAAHTPASDVYYWDSVTPKALRAQITAINTGTKVMTLSVSASATATSANVYFDNYYPWKATWPTLMNSGGAVNDRTYVLPAGKLAFGNRPVFAGQTNCALKGQGDTTNLFSPRGCPSMHLAVIGNTGVFIRDFKVEGNAYLTAYGPRAADVTEDAATSPPEFEPAIHCESNNGLDVRRVHCVQTFRAVAISTGSGTQVVKDCSLTTSDPFGCYVQWPFSVNDTDVAVVVYNCTVTNANGWLLKGFETFSSTGAQFINCGGGALFSSNTSGGYVFQNCYANIAASAFYAAKSVAVQEPILNINRNVGNTSVLSSRLTKLSGGGTVSGFTSSQAGYLNAAKDSLRGIVIQAGVPAVTVSGGTYSAPNYDGGSGTVMQGAVGVSAEGLNNTIDGYVVTGTSSGTGTQSNLYNANGTTRNSSGAVIRTHVNGGGNTGSLTSDAAFSGYNTWNAYDKDAAVTLTALNLAAQHDGSSSNSSVRAVLAVLAGQKKYWEITLTLDTGAYGILVGVANVYQLLENQFFVGLGVNSVGLGPDGQVFGGGASATGIVGGWVQGDRLGVRVDRSVSPPTIAYRKNGGAWSSDLPMPSITGDLYPAVTMSYNTEKVTANFGPSFTDAAPSGFTGLNA